MELVSRRGYLHENYRLFHSRDRRDVDFLTHCHDFHKVLLCLNGHVTYIMEGKTYRLQAWDLMIIPEHQIHQSIFDETETYERMILWINDSYLRSFPDPVLRDIFNQCGLFRPDAADRRGLLEKLTALERAQKSDAPGHALLADSYLVQYLLSVRESLTRQSSDGAVSSDPALDRMLAYINGNLTADLSIDALAKRFFISPSFLMHRFRRCTGCTVHQYVQQKRLLCAHRLIEEGSAVLAAAHSSGFSDYSAFLRAFRRMFGCLPSDVAPSVDK